MSYEHILVEREEGVGIVTLNRPEVLNGMNRRLGTELLHAVKTLEADDDIGCLRAIEAFYAYLDGELDDPESIAEFEHHMAHCRSCFSRTQLERTLTQRMKETARSEAPEALKSRIRNLMNKF